ncbi:MAG: NfeD family protein [Thermodesulfobacteriota bacterium]
MSGLFGPIILQLVGVAVVIAEIIIPSGGLLSLLAAAIFGYSLLLVFQDFSSSVGIGFVIADLVLIPTLVVVGLKLLAKSPATLRTQLSAREGFVSQDPGLASLLGKTGVALTPLRPAGTAEIDGRRVDVVSRGELIAKGSPLEVVAVTGNQTVVRRAEVP